MNRSYSLCSIAMVGLIAINQHIDQSPSSVGEHDVSIMSASKFDVAASNSAEIVSVTVSPPVIQQPRDQFVPKTELGKRMWALRTKAIENGMQLLTNEEILIALGRE